MGTYNTRYERQANLVFFNLVPGESPLILGMDMRAHCNTFNWAKQEYIRLKRPTDSEERVLFTYLVPDDSRLRLDIAPHSRSIVTKLLGNVITTAKRAPLASCMKIHRYTYAIKDEMRELCKEVNVMDDAL